MSYILEALRKSEKERRMGHPPTLQSVVRDVGIQKNRKKWVVGLVLLGMLLGIGALWWDQNTPWVSVIRDHNPASGNSTATVAQQQPKPTISSTKPPDQRMQSLPARQSILQKPTTASSSAGPQSSTIPKQISGKEIIDYTNLEPPQRALWPVLTLNVISYGKIVARRFAMINQKIFKIGQMVQKDLELEQIEPEAVVLRASDFRFRLYPR